MAKFEDGCYGSLKGIALIAKVLAGRCPMHYTRVAAGKGVIPDGLTPKTIDEPPDYVMDAMISSVTNPIDGECQVSVQINSANVEAGFYVTCLLLYAEDPDEGEIPFTYLCLENEPEWVRPASSIVGKLAHFDIISAVGDVDKVTAVIDPDALLTYKDLQELLNGIGTNILNITIPTSGWVPDTETNGEYALHLDIASTQITEKMYPMLSVHPAFLAIAGECMLCRASQTLDGALRLYAQTMPTAAIRASLVLLDTSYQTTGQISGSSIRVLDITVPTSGWTADEDTSGDYALHLDIANAEISEEMAPDLAILPEFLSASAACGFSPSVQTMSGALRVYSKTIPAAPLKASLALMGVSPYTNGNGTALESGTSQFTIPVATGTTLGGVKVKPGSGLTIDSGGNLALDTATAGDVANIFQGSNG